MVVETRCALLEKSLPRNLRSQPNNNRPHIAVVSCVRCPRRSSFSRSADACRDLASTPLSSFVRVPPFVIVLDLGLLLYRRRKLSLTAPAATNCHHLDVSIFKIRRWLTAFFPLLVDTIHWASLISFLIIKQCKMEHDFYLSRKSRYQEFLNINFWEWLKCHFHTKFILIKNKLEPITS